jgi:hypothetical protein
MSDKATNYAKLAKKHLDRIVLVTLSLMLLTLVFLWYQEQNTTVGLAQGEGVPAKFPDPLAENPHYKRINTMAQVPDITKYPAIQQIALYNMFDYKSVRDKAQIERGADQRLAQAQEAANAGRSDEAKKMLGEILRQVPTHKKARELMEKLNPPANPAAATAATPAAGTPVAETP